MTTTMENAYAGSLVELSDRLTRIADNRERQALAFGLRLCRERQLTPVQIIDAVTPYSARLDRLRRSAALAARSAKEMR